MSKTYRIKPLVWEKWGHSTLVAENAACDVRVWADSPYFVWRVDNEIGHADSLESAKLAAESHYQTLIEGALEVVE